MKPEEDNRPPLTPQMLSDRTGISVATLKQYRATGKGPKFKRLTSKHVVYPIAEVEAWEASKPTKTPKGQN